MSRLRRPVLLICGLLLAALGAEIVARGVASTTPAAIRWYDAFAQRKIDQMDNRGHTEVVFAGTSMAWQAFVPSVFDAETGTPSYNAGLNGGTPEVMGRWLLEEVVPRLQPRTVVWGLSSYDFAPHYGDAQRAAYDSALDSRTGLLAELEQRAAEWSVLVRERTVLRSLNDITGAAADDREDAHRRAQDLLGNDGERLDFEIDLSDDLGLVTAARLRGFQIAPTDRAAIAETIAKLQAEGIEVVLVNLPVPDRFVSAHPRRAADYEFVGPAIDRIARETDSRFIDLSAGFEADDFVDYTHLDAEAADEFSVRFSDAWASGRDDRGVFAAVDIPDPVTNESVGEQECPSRLIIDEYGFEVEIADCDGQAPVDMSDPAEVDGTVLLSLRASEEGLRDACENGDEIGPHLLAVAAALDTTRALLVDAGAGDEVERATYDAAEPIALGDGGCTGYTDDPDILRGTAAITSALDRLYALSARVRRTATNLWSHRDRLSVAMWARELNAAGRELDALVVGSSVPRSGIDPEQLGRLTGQLVGNAAISGGTVERFDPWLGRVIEATNPSEIYWAVSFFDIYGNCRVEHRLQEEADDEARLAAAFGDLVSDDSRERWDAFLGPPGELAYTRSPIADTITDAETAGLGLAHVATELNEAALAGQLDQPGGWRLDEPCHERHALVADAIDALQAEGRRVVLYVVPPNPQLLDGFEHELELFQLAAVEYLAAAGADAVLEIELELHDDTFADGVHFTATGREDLTRALADALSTSS